MNGRGFDKIMRTMGPFVAMAAMGGLMAARKRGENWGGGWPNWGADAFDCKFGPGPGPGGRFRFNGREGVPLDQLDKDADVPEALVLASSDSVVIADGADFSITLQGSEAAKAGVRFALEDGALFIMRDGRAMRRTEAEDEDSDGVFVEDTGDSGRATITVTVPPLAKITIAGSGEITARVLAEEAEIVIAGSGRLRAEGIAVERLDVSIAGSGTVKASGDAARLDLSVAGSGNAKMAGLMVGKARVTIAGSGNAVFASDGEVKARLMGSGNVTVRGGARCKVHSMGSGSLVCERRDPHDEGPGEADAA